MTQMAPPPTTNMTTAKRTASAASARQRVDLMFETPPMCNPCCLLPPLEDEVATAPVVPQFRSGATVRVPAEGQKRARRPGLAERPTLDPWQRTRGGAVEGERDLLRRL